MTGQAGELDQTVCDPPLDLRARRSRLTRRIACYMKAGLTLGRLRTERLSKMAVHARLESFSQPDGPLDSELMERISKGDTLAFAEFYDRYSALLFSIAAKVVGDLQEAEEILQDSARLVWERAPLYDPTLGRPLSWAVVITRNKAIDRLRTLQRESKAIARITEQAAADFLAQGRKPPSEAIGSEDCNILRRTLVSLPAEQRIAIELAFFTGLSQTQIAAQLGQPLGTIKARIRRGMLAMRDALEEQL
jgi:RNA polymerase sigma-70 factor (ECF subfamily)